MLQASEACIDVAVHVAGVARHTESHPLRLGPQRARKSPAQACWRLQILDAFQHTRGSPEVLTRSLARGMHGIAALMRAARISLYERKTIEMFGGSLSLCLHWDGSTHSGLDVQLGCVLRTDVGAVSTTYLPPVAP